MKNLTLTKPIQDALDAYREEQGTFVLGRDSMTTIELAKIQLANAVIAEYEAQRKARLPVRATNAAAASPRPRSRTA